LGLTPDAEPVGVESGAVFWGVLAAEPDMVTGAEARWFRLCASSFPGLGLTVIPACECCGAACWLIWCWGAVCDIIILGCEVID
jgi:hypothetical protein